MSSLHIVILRDLKRIHSHICSVTYPALEPWLRAKLALISQKTKPAEAIRYALSRWDGLTRKINRPNRCRLRIRHRSRI